MKTRPARVGAALLVLTMYGCATSAIDAARGVPEGVRAANEAERAQIADAVSLLLPAIDDLVRRAALGRQCDIPLGVIQSPRIHAAVAPAAGGGCVDFALVVTTGAVSNLPPAEMMALLAHELAHVRLGHLDSGRTSKGDGLRYALHSGSGSGQRPPVVFTDPPPAFADVPTRGGREDERQADALAVRLLFSVGREPACAGLVSLLERIAVAANGSDGGWLATHPPAARRARDARELCERLALLRPG